MANETVIGLDDTHGLIGNPIDVFNTLGSDVQSWIMFATGFAALVFIIVTILCLIRPGGHST